jgi:hypothetical protein
MILLGMLEDRTMPRCTLSLLVTFALALLLAPLAAEAQPPGKGDENEKCMKVVGASNELI